LNRGSINGLSLAKIYDCRNRVNIPNKAFVLDYDDGRNELYTINKIFLPF